MAQEPLLPPSEQSGGRALGCLFLLPVPGGGAAPLLRTGGFPSGGKGQVAANAPVEEAQGEQQLSGQPPASTRARIRDLWASSGLPPSLVPPAGAALAFPSTPLPALKLLSWRRKVREGRGGVSFPHLGHRWCPRELFPHCLPPLPCEMLG